MDLDVLKVLRRNLVLVSMLELICGLFMIVFNSNSLSMLIKMLGIVAAAYGLITFVIWLIKRDDNQNAAVTMVLGVVTGVLLISLTDHVIEVFTIIAGIFAGIFGISKMPNMFSVKKAGFKKWWLMLLPMVLIVGVGIFIGLSPTVGSLNTKSLTAILLGVALILGCAADIIATAGAANVERQLAGSKEVDMPEDEPK